MRSKRHKKEANIPKTLFRNKQQHLLPFPNNNKLLRHII